MANDPLRPSKSGNGAAAPEQDSEGQGGPTPDEVGFQMIASIVHAFAPHLPPPVVMQLVQVALGQQQNLGQVLTDAVTPETVAKYPLWGYKFLDSNGRELAGVICPKAMGEAKSLDEVMHHATVIALASSPVARAVLNAYGWRIEFFQGAKPEAPRIVLPD